MNPAARIDASNVSASSFDEQQCELKKSFAFWQHSRQCHSCGREPIVKGDFCIRKNSAIPVSKLMI